MPTDRELKLKALAAIATDEPGDDFARRPIDQRLDRINVGLDNLYEAIAALTERLQPILPLAEELPDDGPEASGLDGTSPVSRRLALLADNAHHLADKLHAITAAVEL